MTLKPTRENLEKTSRELMGYVDHVYGAKTVGFTLFVSTFGEGGHIAYISSVEREDMLKALREFVAYQEAGLTTDPTGPRAES